jgi:acyl dehydratase
LDRSAIGRESKPAVHEIEPGSIRRFARSLGEQNPIYFDDAAARAAGYSGLVAPLTFPASLRAGSDLRAELLVAPGSHLLQAQQSFEYARPVVAGDRITVRSKVVEINQRDTPTGPADEVVLEDEGTDAGGAVVYRARSLWVVRAPPKQPGTGEVIHE